MSELEVSSRRASVLFSFHDSPFELDLQLHVVVHPAGNCTETEFVTPEEPKFHVPLSEREGGSSRGKDELASSRQKKAWRNAAHESELKSESDLSVGRSSDHVLLLRAAKGRSSKLRAKEEKVAMRRKISLIGKEISTHEDSHSNHPSPSPG